jgi:SAM-dependent methyltransferase
MKESRPMVDATENNAGAPSSLRTLKSFIRRLPVIGPLASAGKTVIRRMTFQGSASYWESRYTEGGTSGEGSGGPMALFKADFLNAFVRDHGIQTVIEFGCGDGRQLALAEYPRYTGLDVSKTAIRTCSARFDGDQSKSFFLLDQDAFVDRSGVFRSDLAISLDVIYHLIEDRTFETYMTNLFQSAGRFVIVYSSNEDKTSSLPHVRHRKFTAWIEQHQPEWKQIEFVRNKLPFRGDDLTGSFSDFFVFERAGVVSTSA